MKENDGAITALFTILSIPLVGVIVAIFLILLSILAILAPWFIWRTSHYLKRMERMLDARLPKRNTRKVTGNVPLPTHIQTRKLNFWEWLAS